MKTTIALFFAITLSLSMAGCNVFDGLYEEGTSSSPEILLADARIAMVDGRVDDAVVHLSKAHEKQPNNIEVRVELASALLTQNKIDVMLIKDLAGEIESEGETGGASKRLNCSDAFSCNFDCNAAKSVAPFSYKDSNAYRKLAAALDVLERVDVLVSVPLEELGATSGRRYDTKEERKELFEALVAKIAETNPQQNARRIAAMLLLDAGITRLSTTLTNLEESSTNLNVTLYHVERMDGSKYVDYCGDDIESFISGTMCLASSSALFTLDLLETRLENFTDSRSQATSMASDLVDAGHELFDGLTSEIKSECGS